MGGVEILWCLGQYFQVYLGCLVEAPLPMQRDASRHQDRKSTRLNSSHTEIYTLSLHDALPIYGWRRNPLVPRTIFPGIPWLPRRGAPPYAKRRLAPSRSEEHTSELQSHRDLHSFPTRRSSDLWVASKSFGASDNISRYTLAASSRRPSLCKETPRAI